MIDFERAGEMKRISFTRPQDHPQGWLIDGHEVAWLEFHGTRPDGSTYSGKELYCECDFVEGSAPTFCEHKKTVYGRLREAAKDQFGQEWLAFGHKEAILDIFKRASAKEQLFEHHHGIIYIQEIAELLGISEKDIWALCDELFAEEKLDLNGAILTPYLSRFRFPKEIQNLFAYMKEEPLGWPNGEAGDCFLEELEGVIHKNTRFKHGKDAFWKENYPHIAPHHLLHFGLNWMAIAIGRAENNAKACEDLKCFKLENIARHLEDLAKRLRKLAKKRGKKKYIVMTGVEPFEILFAGSKKKCEAFYKSLPTKEKKRVVIRPENYLK